MKQAKAKLYIRFGDIPEDQISHVHFGDADIRPEGGLSVWPAIRVNNRYYPMLPKNANEDGATDFYDMLLDSEKTPYLVTGVEMRLKGADMEPLLAPGSVIVLKKLPPYVGHPPVVHVKSKKTNSEEEECVCKTK